MSAKAIREATGKDIINRLLQGDHGAAQCRFATVTETTQWPQLVQDNPWLETSVSIARSIVFVLLGLLKVIAARQFNEAETLFMFLRKLSRLVCVLILLRHIFCIVHNQFMT